MSGLLGGWRRDRTRPSCKLIKNLASKIPPNTAGMDSAVELIPSAEYAAVIAIKLQKDDCHNFLIGRHGVIPSVCAHRAYKALRLGICTVRTRSAEVTIQS